MPANADVLITISAKDLASAVFKQIGADTKAGLDKGIKGLEKYQAGLEKTGKAATKLGKGLSIGVTAPLAAFGAVAVNSAVKAERLTKTLEGLAGGADEAAGFIDAIKDASLGTIPQVQALEIANSALSFGVVETEEGMASLVETAIVLGKAQGLDAATAVGDLTTALARQSPMILDNLGITLKMSEASLIAAENASAFGFEADNLTKAQEFQIAAMVKGREAAAKMGGMQEDMATKVERAKAKVSDMTTTLGAGLIPALETALDVVTPIITAFGDMDPATQKMVVGLAAVAAGAGPVLGAFGAATTAAGTFTAAITAAGGGAAGLQAVLTGTTASLLAVAAAAVAVGATIVVYNQQQEKVAAAAGNAEVAAGSMTQEMSAQVEAGQSLSTVLSVSASRMNKATDQWDNMSNAAKVGSKIFGGADQMTKVLSKSQQGMTQVIIQGSNSFEQVNANIELYNSKLNDSDAQVEQVTRAQFDYAKSLQEGDVSLKRLFPTLTKQNEKLKEVVKTSAEYDAVTFGTTEAINQETDATEQLTLAQQENLLSIDMLSSSQERATGRAEQMGAMVEMTGQAIDSADARTHTLANRTEQLAGSHQRAGGAVSDLSGVLENATSIREKSIAIGDMQAASAQRQAEALEASRQAAIGAAEAQVALASSLMGATDAQIASALIQQLDPEELGAAAYAKGVTEIQVAFGLADEKSIALAQNLVPLAEAMNEGIVPVEQYDEALAALIADAADGEVNTGALLDQFARAPELIGPSAEKLNSLNEKLAINSEESITAAEGVEAFGSGAAGMAPDVDVLTGSVVRLNEELKKAGNATLPDFSGGGGTPRFQFGGVVPGPLGGAPRLVMAEPGEVFIPPSQQNSVNNNFGGNTQTVTINDSGALGFFEEQQRQDRLSLLTANL